MLGGHISHHNSHYISHFLSSLLLVFTVFLGWPGSVKPPIATAAVDGQVVADPEHTQDFFAAFGDASVQRGADGNWSQVVLTPAAENKAGAVTLNNRLNFSKDFKLQYQMRLGPGNGVGDGISFALYPGQIGAVGMWGGNLGVGGLPNALAFKFDNYTNAKSNRVFNETSSYPEDTQEYFRSWIRWKIAPNYENRGTNPYTDTRKYAGAMRTGNTPGAVWGDVDEGLVGAPYGSFLETNEAGTLRVMGTNTPHYFLRRIVTAALPDTKVPFTPLGGKVIDSYSQISSNFVDGSWHGVEINYTVDAANMGTMTVSLYNGTTYDPANIYRTWKATINVNDLIAKTDNKPFFALNIAGSNGSSTANQAVKNLYAEYTPEPGAFTTRFVDENGTTIADAINQGRPEDVSHPFNLTIPKFQTRPANPLQGKYQFDYATLETYNHPQGNTKVKVELKENPDGTSYNYPGTYTTPYQRLNAHYKKVTNYPTTDWSIKDAKNTVTSSDQSLSFSTNQNTPVTYTFNLKMPNSAPDPWTGVKIKTMVPAGLRVDTATVTTKNGTASGTPINGSAAQQSDGRTQVTFNTLDLYGTGASAQPNSAQVQLTMTPLIALKDTIQTSVEDTYMQDSDKPVETSYWADPLPTMSTSIEIIGTQTPATVWIKIPTRSSTPIATLTRDDLRLPAGVTQITRAVWHAADNGLPDTDAQVEQTAETLPLVSIQLKNAGPTKLTANDWVSVGVFYTGKTDSGQTYYWVVNYNLYEPLSTWMPNDNLAKLVAAQIQPALTDYTKLQKSMMPTLTNFVGDGKTWTIAKDPTGLEYATKLQSFTAPGTNATAEQVKDGFRRLITTFATDRGQTGTPATTLITLTLSNYPKEVFIPSVPATVKPNPLPALPALTTFTATQDGLEPAQMSDAKGSDLAAFLSQPAAPKLKTLDVSNNEPVIGNTNPNKLSSLIIGPSTIEKIDQRNMIGPNIPLSLTMDKNDPNTIMITGPKNGTNIIDLRTKLSTLTLADGTVTAFTPNDATSTQVAFFDQSKPNIDLTSLLNSQNPGQVNIKYQDYMSFKPNSTGAGYLRFNYKKDNTVYSVWMPTMIKGQTAIAVSGDLNFGTRRLAAGDYPNDGRNDITGTQSSEGAKPITITTVYNPNPKSQVTVQVTPFAAGSSTVNTFILRLGSHDIPAIGEGGSTVLPELTNDTGLVDTQNYTAVLHVPNTAGILAGQKYSADVTYTLTDGL